MSEERERLRRAESSEEPDDVEAHRLNQRMGEAEDKFGRMGEPEDKFGATDEDDVEAHVLSPKVSPGKVQS